MSVSGKMVARVLDRAAQLVAENGLAKGHYHSRIEGSFCTLGAIRQATADELGVLIDELPTDAVFPAQMPHGQDVAVWNDAPSRNRVDVVRALRRAALLASEGGK